MQDRKTQILDAAVSLLASRGYAGLSHRAVDAQADLSPGSTTYYFSKKIALVEATALHLAELMEADCAHVKLRFADLVATGQKDEAIEYVTNDIVEFAEKKREWMLARFELVLVGARDQELRPISNRLDQASKELTAFFVNLVSDGLSDAQIETCVSILDAMALMYVTGRGSAPNKDQIKRILLTA
ncbi:MAG: TetR family transcriptional regulator [Pseudomonadota bacterium]